MHVYVGLCVSLCKAVVDSPVAQVLAGPVFSG